MIDASLLPTFLAVYDAGRISAAAKALRLSQPAVTAQIRRLEDQVGAPLFTRSVHGVSPTPAGEKLAVSAQTIDQLLDDVLADIGTAPAIGDDLVLSASTTIAAHVLPPLLAQFRRSHREVRVRIDVANTEDVLEHVRGGLAPLGLIEGHPRAAGVRIEPYLADEIVPIVGASERVRDLADLGARPILWREAGSGTRAVVARALSRAKVRQKVARHDIELGSTEAIIEAAIAGLGVGFVSRWSIRTHIAAGVVRIPPVDLVVRRAFCWALPSGSIHGAAARFYALALRTPPVL
ncbi:MAG TPA: LysR family transcriptional regulator [Kofleriaceae bacterium]